MIALLLLPSVVHAAPPAGAAEGVESGARTAVTATQEIRVEVLTEPRVWSPALVAILHRPEGDVRVPLLRDAERQGFSTGSARGVPVRFLDLEVQIQEGPGLPGAGPYTVWRRVVPVQRTDAGSVLLLLEQDGLLAERVAWMPFAGGAADAGDVVSLAVAFGWGGLCFAYIGWLARAARR